MQFDAALRADKQFQTANAAENLRTQASIQPDAPALTAHRYAGPKGTYDTLSFAELDRKSDQAAAGLLRSGFHRGGRVLMMVPPGEEFVVLWFALLKIGACAILIDPGMGGRNLLRCIEEAEPDAMIGIPAAHALRRIARKPFKKMGPAVSVGKYLSWGGIPYAHLLRGGVESDPLATVEAQEPAAIVFTTGSTGRAKGVVCSHEVFNAQIELLRKEFSLSTADCCLCAFLPFALYCIAMGTRAVMPDIDPRKPAKADPAQMAALAAQHRTTYSFGSPAFWRPLAEHCAAHRLRLGHLRQVIMFGAPMPRELHERIHRILPEHGSTYTPYGATEALPVSSISGRELCALPEQRFGVCVGAAVSGTQVKVIKLCDEALPRFEQIEEMPQGEIGEILVSGRQVTREYCRRPKDTTLAKVYQGSTVWHRMGDVGYLDEQNRLWFCGRMKHRVTTETETLFTVPCEAVFNEHPEVRRSALVGIGKRGAQTPVLCVERASGSKTAEAVLRRELQQLGVQHHHTRNITQILFHPSLPVDFRHNAKIIREELSIWAARKLW